MTHKSLIVATALMFTAALGTGMAVPSIVHSDQTIKVTLERMVCYTHSVVLWQGRILLRQNEADAIKKAMPKRTLDDRPLFEAHCTLENQGDTPILVQEFEFDENLKFTDYVDERGKPWTFVSTAHYHAEPTDFFDGYNLLLMPHQPKAMTLRLTLCMPQVNGVAADVASLPQRLEPAGAGPMEVQTRQLLEGRVKRGTCPIVLNGAFKIEK